MVISLICDIAPLNCFQLAINSSGDLFTADLKIIEQINDSICNVNTVANVGGNSLSFGTQNNLYFNDLSEASSAVYRYDAGFGNPPYLWHDFSQGVAGGDFVILENFMCIAWKNFDNINSLFKLNVDANVNCVSHEIVGGFKIGYLWFG